MKSLFFTLLTFITVGFQNLHAEVKGKVDVGAAFMHVDILESGHTVKRMDMWGVRGDFSYFLYKGLYVKPVVLYGTGGASRGGLFSSSLGLGYCLPITKSFTVSPSVGVTYSHLWTKIDIEPLQLKNLRENFRSWAPYLSFDIYYNFCSSSRIGFNIQYAWSHSKTSIQKVTKNHKSSPEGFAYSVLLEHDLSEKWSINLGAIYNLSLTHEKHGLRGSGVKAGLVRWF